MNKKDFKLGEAILKGNEILGIYVEEMEGNCLGIITPGFEPKLYKLNLDTHEFEEVDGNEFI